MPQLMMRYGPPRRELEDLIVSTMHIWAFPRARCSNLQFGLPGFGRQQDRNTGYSFLGSASPCDIGCRIFGIHLLIGGVVVKMSFGVGIAILLKNVWKLISKYSKFQFVHSVYFN